jgi:hypothetical protein
MEAAKGVSGNVGVLEKGMPRQGLCGLLQFRGPDALGWTVHVEVTSLGDLPWEVRLGQLPEVHALPDVLRPPRHIFFQLLVVVSSKHLSVEYVADFSLVLQDTEDVSRVLDGLGASEVECFNFQIGPACSTTMGKRTAHYSRSSMEEQGFDGLITRVNGRIREDPRARRV